MLWGGRRLHVLRAGVVYRMRQSFVRKASRDACARVKCAGGAANLTIQWFDGGPTSCPNALPKPYALRVRLVGRTLCTLAL
jgi:hypothetical protein